ncbi:MULTISPECIES: hypothetical protein [unclassified Phenylobacterium]|jgi:hypothetical protein|uniref:hypothetical protein n=1 Tax=unclassified Phenylobacterium TaxID=2640670 RepID=UPI00083A6D23|nr:MULTISPECIES: hypothetical protein [unclassified Phenylobacterium]
MSDSSGRDSSTFAGLTAFGHALVVMVLAAAIGLVWTSVDATRTKREIAYQQARERCQGATNSDCQELATAIRSAVAGERAADLAAQQLWLNIIGIIGLGATVLFAAFAWREAQRAAAEAREANRISREALFSDQRAWLEIDQVTIETDLRWTETEARITFWFTYKNIGNTPARGVTTDAVLHYDFLKWPHEVRREMMAAKANQKPFFGQLVFPNRELRQGLGLVVTIDELNAYDARMQVEFAGDRVAPGWNHYSLVGCVTYWSAGDVPHQTGFVFDLRPETPYGVSHAFKRGQDVPKTHMFLQRSHHGDIEAT